MNYRDSKSGNDVASNLISIVKKNTNVPLLVVFVWLCTVLYFSQTTKKLLVVIEKQHDQLEQLQSLQKQYHEEFLRKSEVVEKKLTHLGQVTTALVKANAAKSKRTSIDGETSKITEGTPLDMKIEYFTIDRQALAKEGAIRSRNPARKVLKDLKAVIITGADTKYYSALMNLVGSVHFWDPLRNIVIYDLGLTEEEVKSLTSMDRVRVEQSPIKTELKNYAWKAQCIRSATEAYGKTIWLDAGSDLRGDPVVIDRLLETEDMFFVQGQDMDMSPWSDPQTLSFFHTNKQEMRGKYSFSGNLQGYMYDSQAYWEVLMVVEKCCKIRDCIAPPGSSLSTHRYDQIAMSGAIYTNPNVNVIPHTELLAAERRQLAQDHKKPSSNIVWSARGGSSDYIPYIKRDRVPFDAPTVEELMVSN